jgi:hypothetical protein
LPIRLILPVISCFLDPESRNLNGLVLIHRRIARDARGEIAPAEAASVARRVYARRRAARRLACVGPV